MSGDPVLIRRTGSTPLALVGYKQVASASSKTEKGTRSKRWHEVDLWRDERPRDTGKHDGAAEAVVAVRYRSEWPGEAGREWAFPVPWDKVPALLVGLESEPDGWHPMDAVAGYPDAPQFKSKQERLIDDLTDGWESLVSDVLGAAGFSEAL